VLVEVIAKDSDDLLRLMHTEVRGVTGVTEVDTFMGLRIAKGTFRYTDLGRAREFFQKSWDLGPIPTAAYNLACLDDREGKKDSAVKQLENARGGGLVNADPRTQDPDIARRSPARRRKDGRG